MKKYRVSFTIGDKVFLYNQFSSSYDHNWYKPVFTRFSLEVTEDGVEWATILSYEDVTRTYNSQRRFIMPSVYINCQGDDCVSYTGWVNAFNNATNPTTDSTTAASIATFANSGLDFFTKQITSDNNENDETYALENYIPFSKLIEEVDGSGEYRIYDPNNSTSLNTIAGKVGIRCLFNSVVGTAATRIGGQFVFARCRISFTDFDDNSVARGVNVDINIYETPVSPHEESGEITSYHLSATSYSITSVSEEEMVEGLPPLPSYNSWYGTFTAICDDPYEVPVSAPDVSKVYDSVGWRFPNDQCPTHKNFTAGDGTFVPVTITYSPSSTPKDVSGEGEYQITATFEIDSDPAYTNYYLDEETKTFIASITPCPITLPCVFENPSIHSKVYDGTPHSFHTSYEINMFPDINEGTGETVYRDTIVLGIEYTPDLSSTSDVYDLTSVSAEYTGTEAYTNYRFIVSSDCSPNYYEITCRPLAISGFEFPDEETYFDICGYFINGYEDGDDVKDDIDVTGLTVGNLVGDDTVEVELTSASIGYYHYLVSAGQNGYLVTTSGGIRYSFSHNNPNYCDIEEGYHSYFHVAPDFEIMPFGDGELDSRFDGAVAVSEAYFVDGNLRHRDVYYPESFTFVIRCHHLTDPGSVTWDGDRIYLDPPIEVRGCDRYYSVTIHTSPNEVEENGETHIEAHKLVCGWVELSSEERYGFGNSYSTPPDYAVGVDSAITGYYAPVLVNGGSFYSGVYDGVNHNPVMIPASVLLDSDVPVTVTPDPSRNPVYWCYVDGWVENYHIKHAADYTIRFQQNAKTNDSRYVGLYEEGEAAITPKQLTVSSITKPWDGTKSSVKIEEDDDGNEVTTHNKKALTASGWMAGDGYILEVLGDYEFPSSDVAYYCCTTDSCPDSPGWYKKENGNWELITEDGWSVAGGKYIVPECVEVSGGEIVYREPYNKEYSDTYDHGYPTDYTIGNEVLSVQGEITLSGLLFQTALYRGNDLEWTWEEENEHTVVYDAQPHTIRVDANDILKQMPGFGDFEVTDNMVSWVLKRAKNDNVEENILNENGVDCLHADTYTVQGYLDMQGRDDETETVGLGLFRVQLIIAPRPLYLTNLTVSYDEGG